MAALCQFTAHRPVQFVDVDDVGEFLALRFVQFVERPQDFLVREALVDPAAEFVGNAAVAWLILFRGLTYRWGCDFAQVRWQ